MNSLRGLSENQKARISIRKVIVDSIKKSSTSTAHWHGKRAQIKSFDMTESAEFNIRQYKRMLDVIDRFERRQTNISHLITVLT